MRRPGCAVCLPMALLLFLCRVPLGWPSKASSGGSGPSLLPLPQTKGVNLSCVRTCMVVAEERPRIALTQSFSKLFKDLGLPARAVSTTFGCRVNVAICLQVRPAGGPPLRRPCAVLPPALWSPRVL